MFTQNVEEYYYARNSDIFNFKKVSKLIWAMPKKRVFSLLGFRPLELCRNGGWLNYFSPSIFLPPHPIHHLREGSTRCPPLPTSLWDSLLSKMWNQLVKFEYLIHARWKYVMLLQDTMEMEYTRRQGDLAVCKSRWNRKVVVVQILTNSK